MLKDYLRESILEMKRRWWFYLFLPIVMAFILLLITDFFMDGESVDIFSTKFAILISVMYPMNIIWNLLKAVENWLMYEKIKFLTVLGSRMGKGLLQGLFIAILVIFADYGSPNFEFDITRFFMLVGIVIVMESILVAFDYNKRKKDIVDD